MKLGAILKGMTAVVALAALAAAYTTRIQPQHLAKDLVRTQLGDSGSAQFRNLAIRHGMLDLSQRIICGEVQARDAAGFRRFVANPDLGTAVIENADKDPAFAGMWANSCEIKSST
jgi:hypothetical protein